MNWDSVIDVWIVKRFLKSQNEFIFNSCPHPLLFIQYSHTKGQKENQNKCAVKVLLGSLQWSVKLTIPVHHRNKKKRKKNSLWHKLSLLSSLSRSSQKHISSHFVIVLCCFAKIYSSYPFLKKLASQKEKKKTRFKLVLKHFTQQNNCTEHLWTVFIQNPRRNIQQRESNVTVEWLGVRRLFEREQMKTAHCKVCGLSWVNLAMISWQRLSCFSNAFFWGALSTSSWVASSSIVFEISTADISKTQQDGKTALQVGGNMLGWTVPLRAHVTAFRAPVRVDTCAPGRFNK